MVKSKLHKTRKIVDVPDDLKVKEELIGLHSINPFVTNNSSARGYMLSGFLSQIVVPDNGEEKIIQTGLEEQFGDNTFSVKFENDSTILGVVKRYSGVDMHTADETITLTIFYEDMVTREVDYIEVPYYFSLHQYFGFKYDWKEEALSLLVPGTFVPAGTIIADSPSNKDGKRYAFGFNTNVCYMSLPEISEDGIVISEEYAERASFTIFEKRTIEFGTDSFPLNLYGDDEIYKPFPNIGEYVNPDGALMAIREYDDNNILSLTTVNDVKKYNPIFDKVQYVKSNKAKVIDIEAYNSPKFKRSVYTGTDNGLMRYVKGLTKYHTDLVNLYEKLERDHYGKTKSNLLPITDKLQRLMVDAYMKSGIMSDKTKFMHKKSRLDLYRVDITVEIKIPLKVGFKLTNLSGAKGIIVEIRPSSEMPYNPITGERADVVFDPTSVSNRMIAGALYEQHMNMMSRRVKSLVTNELSIKGKTVEQLTDDEVNKLWSIPLGLVELIGTEQYTYYNQASINEKRHILQETVDKEFFLYYSVSSERKPYQIVNDAKGTIYEPIISNLTWTKNGKKIVTKTPIYIGPQYVIILSKLGDDSLVVSSSKQNHYGQNISGSSGIAKHGYPYKHSGCKAFGETETRVYTSYVGREAMAELKDRSNSLESHKVMYKNFLTVPKPTNVSHIIDRKIVPFGGDVSLTFMRNIMEPSGIELTYVKGR